VTILRVVILAGLLALSHGFTLSSRLSTSFARGDARCCSALGLGKQSKAATARCLFSPGHASVKTRLQHPMALQMSASEGGQPLSEEEVEAMVEKVTPRLSHGPL